MKQIVKFFLFALFFTGFNHRAFVEVTSSSDSGFVSEHRLILKGSPQTVYQALTKDINLWWDAEHSYSGQAKNFSLEAIPGGCFCEKIPGGGVEHMRVVYADPGKQLRLSGGLGPLQEMAVVGSMDFKLVGRKGGTTELIYRYSVGGYVPGGLAPLAGPVDQVQLDQLKRLQSYLTKGGR